MAASDKPTIRLPAVCDDCGRVFGSAFTLSLGAWTTVERCSAGPCPYCGHDNGTIPDGKYEYNSETEAVIRSFSPQRQRDLIKAIEAAQEAANPRKALAEVIESEPELAAIAKRLLIPKDAAAFWSFVATVLAIVQLLNSGPGGTTVIKEQTNVIERIFRPPPSQKATKKKKQARKKRAKPHQRKKGSKKYPR